MTKKQLCPIAKHVAEKVITRSRAGVKKYGTDMTRKDLQFFDWLQHLQEELLDAAVYIERIKHDI